MERGAITIGPHVEDGGRSGNTTQPLHGRGVDAMLLHREENPVGLLVIAHGAHGKALEAQLRGVDNGAACCARQPSDGSPR